MFDISGYGTYEEEISKKIIFKIQTKGNGIFWSRNLETYNKLRPNVQISEYLMKDDETRQKEMKANS